MFTLAPAEKRLTGAFPIRCDHARFDEMEKLTMPTNRVPKAIQSRTLTQSDSVPNANPKRICQPRCAGALIFLATDARAVAAEAFCVRWAEFASSQ